MPFKDLGLSPELLKALKPKTYPAPTPVQLELIPGVLLGRDAWVTAPTGSGKTLAYTLPLIEKLARTFPTDNAHPTRSLGDARNTKLIRTLVLVPTRE
jgi:superfamily II DNA/RNA helicase